MASDTSLVFNLIARDQASAKLQQFQERITTASAAIGAGVGAALGVGITEALNVEAANNKLAAQLGLGSAEASQVAAVSAKVFGGAWGDSVDTVNLAIKGVYQNIGDTSKIQGGLEGVTTKALALAEAFDQDLTMTTAAVGQLMRTGLAKSAEEAFDIITVGLGTAADKSGDFLETINEYSTQFRRVGLDGQTATGLLVQALKAGARDADQVADAIGQFGERALAGGKPIEEAFKAIGLSSDKMVKMIGQGGPQAAKALQMTMDGLRKTKDEQVKLNVAAALFGDPGNVMGASLFALDPATAAAAAGMDKAAGATDRLVEKVGSSNSAKLEEFKRKVTAELAEAGAAVIDFAMKHQTYMEPLAYTLLGLAATVLIVKGAMMTYAAVAAIVAAANAIISASTWTIMGNWMRMMALGLMAYAQIAGAAVVSAAMTAAAWVGSALTSIGTWVVAVVRAGVVAVGQFAMMAARAVIWAAVMAAQWLIAMGPIGWIIAAVIGLVALIIYYWDEIKAVTVRAWNAIWSRAKELTTKNIGNIVSFIGGLPGQIQRIFSSAGDWLVSAGQNVVLGLWHGIQGMGGWLRSTLMGWARNLIPGPIAKALGIASPSKLMADQVGQWIPAGVVLGIEARQDDVARAMATLVPTPAAGQSVLAGQQLAGGTGGGPLMRPGFGPQQVRVIFDVRGGESALTKFFRHNTRVIGQGSTQTAYGQ